MNFLSLCSGIEAASAAFEPLGWIPVGFSEIEAFPSAVLAERFPDVPNFGDMTRFAEWPDEVFLDADVIVGGPPCQAFSVAGLRGGLTDARGNLTLVYVKLIHHADAIRKRHGKRPAITIFENVCGILTDRTNALGALLGGLAGEDEPLVASGKKWTDAGCVFGPERAVAWRCLDAQYFGVAQRRKRLFLVSGAGDVRPDEILFEFEGLRRDSEPGRVPGQETAETAGRGAGGTSHWSDLSNPHPTLNQSHNTGGLGASNQEIFSQGGSGLVPMMFDIKNGLAPHGSPQLRALSTPLKASDHKDPQLVLRPGALLARKLMPVEAERLQGFPDGWTRIPWRGKPEADCPDGHRYKSLGNSMAVPVMSFLGRRIAAHLGASSSSGVAASPIT